jgi:hypothetical protein
VMMVESSRRHGHFDGRYPVLPKLAAYQAYKHSPVLREEAA